MEGNGANHRRSFFEIMAQILSTCQPRAKKTTLMYRCNMSFPQLMDYLTTMLSAQLLEIGNNGGHFLFRISGEGKEFLKAYGGLMSLIE